ncbi:hypothetical protein BDB00DRAFT_839366 [Zychaea mexicana]|uniref:uncharacterized protein n=1 Tax=Zychaea mexicana TaxID=64656 RepID=UPI0022FEB9F9|nr:uncharacterized protein BDB00DRAFT_839366 [Zychaea mexicana]KAI9490175.1 hypothetical protein BDB00DRAFT_839366 [Zychaea mexicana]
MVSDNINIQPGATSELCFQLVRPPTKTSRTNDNQRNNNEQSSCMGIISSFPIIHETPKRGSNGKKLHSTDSNSTGVQQHQQHPPQQRAKSSELRFKIESVGTQLEEDDDLEMCPARTRVGWPTQIIPWWKPNHPCEKPPYSYATLIAHAILTSKDGRLTLSDIYKWISENYPHYVLGQQGWQNSIRHNLSLNKKWFFKLDRRPTQANPGKGCYWTLVIGTEQIFIDNLTQAGGHSRKHHDIGLTAELSMGHRRGSCYYGPTSVAPATDVLGSTALSHDNMLITRPEDYESPKKTPASKEPAKMSPLYTTFRMNDQADDKKRENGSLHKKRINKRRKQQKKRREPGSYAESEYDSGVDVSSKYVPHHKKDKQQQQQQQPSPSTTTTTTTVPTTATTDLPWQQDLLDLTLDVTRPLSQLNLGDDANAFMSYIPDDSSNTSWMQPWFTTDPASTTAIGAPAPAMASQQPLYNNAVLDHTQWNVEQQQSAWDDTLLQLQNTEDFFTPNMTPSTSYPTLLASRYDPADEPRKDCIDEPQCSYVADMTRIEESLKELVAIQQQQQQQQQPQPPQHQQPPDVATVAPSAVILEQEESKLLHQPLVINLDDEVTTQYLHFEEEEDDGDADDETDGDDDDAVEVQQQQPTHGYGTVSDCDNNINLLYPGSVEDAPSSILDHHEFVSMSQLLYS